MLGPPHVFMDPYSEEEDIMNAVVKRFTLFKERCDEKEEAADDSPNTNGEMEMEYRQ